MRNRAIQAAVRAVLVAIPLFALAAPVRADSDGYYCIGRDYIAYQFGLSAPPVAPHRVYTIKLFGDESMGQAGGIQIPQFQVFGMLCGEGTVQLEAFDGLYTVYLDTSRHPISLRMDRCPQASDLGSRHSIEVWWLRVQHPQSTGRTKASGERLCGK
jgi:hypothetical protein